MTLDELVNDEVFRKASGMVNFIKLFDAPERIFCNYEQHIVNCTTKLLSISKHIQNKITIYDYTTLTQDEISKIVNAKIKYDFRLYDYNKFSKIFSKIISENNDNIKKYNLSQVTPDLLHEIINKNEVFIANLNSLYASNKILTELNAL